MKKVILDSLEDFVFKSNTDLEEFKGYTVTKNIDIHGNTYELKDDEEKYLLLTKVEGSSVFISENKLLYTLLANHIKEIENKSIYEHGYPESRLIPPNFYEKCEEEFKEYILEDIKMKVNDILDGHFNY